MKGRKKMGNRKRKWIRNSSLLFLLCLLFCILPKEGKEKEVGSSQFVKMGVEYHAAVPQKKQGALQPLSEVMKRPEVKTKEAEKEEEEKEEEKEEKEEEKEEEEKGEEKEAPELPEESVLPPEIQYPEADGKQGYYLFFPDIRIRHREPGTVTNYVLLPAEGKRTEGSLELTEEETAEILLEGTCMAEGENTLYVWMEHKENPSREPLFFQKYSFFVDTKKPAPVSYTYSCVPSGSSIFAREAVEIFINGKEEDKDVEQICYQIENGDSGILSAEGGAVLLQPGFHGRLEAYAVDHAGNRSEPAVSHEIFCENMAPEVQLYIEGGTDIWHTAPVTVQVNIKEHPEETGIQSVTCYSKDRIFWQKDMGQAGSMNLECDFTVDLASEGGSGIPVTVEAMDRAGNMRTETRMLYIDKAAPVIQSEGLYDQMISAEAVSGRIEIQEDNVLDFGKIEIWRNTPSGERESLQLPRAGQGDVKKDTGLPETGWEISLMEDGIYEIYVTGRDLAGHEVEQQYRITVDGTSPVIRYVNQMQGAYIPYFQWNYEREGMFWDFTEYSYEMRLDGRFYMPGRRVTEEGSRRLQVEAVDAAGNRSVAEAVFQIDHTPPDIRIYNVEDRKIYEDAVEMSISVDGEGEYLKEVQVNSEKMRLEEGCQVFQKKFQEPCEYQVKVQAEDPAGNREQTQIVFQIEEKRAESLWSPVKKIFQREEVSPAGFREKENEKKKEKKIPAAGIVILFLPAAVLLPILRRYMIYRKRK